MASGEFQIIRKHQSKTPVDVIAIAEEIGLPVYEDDEMADNISGMLVKDKDLGGKTGYCIIVNADHHPNRKRFTIAHEIAHYVLHRDEVGDSVEDNKLYRSHLSNSIEAQANKLAADILMPWDLINQLTDSAPSQDVASLAKKLQVSQSAMAIRLGVPAD